MTTTEQIGQQLKALPPELPEVDDRLEQIEVRVVRRRRRVTTATAAGALAVVLAGWGLTQVVGESAYGPAGTTQTTAPGVEFSNRSPGTILGWTELGDPTTIDGRGEQDIRLPEGPYPDGTEALSLSLSCTDEAYVLWPFAGIYTSCRPADQPAPEITTFSGEFLVPIDEADETFAMQVSDDSAWRLVVTPVEVDQIPLGVNERGQTYGVDNPLHRPDLMEVRRPDLVGGYVDRLRFERLLPPAPEPEELRAGRTGGDSREMQTIEVPIYASDGVTLKGSYEIQVPVEER